ncbi:Crp/Fnr family transcriptional regulator [Oecophyllibacter saccharovorans]|uniref:Crp/Fnr family transcriptional regulator n=1 Tax=Oecophyllibacter saccharovorans TaxID=2558360 RepID=UPI00240D0059|nr:Crp/Fnr family transcriptional regulator [Oecophyllibacter saccharovorans]
MTRLDGKAFSLKTDRKAKRAPAMLGETECAGCGGLRSALCGALPPEGRQRLAQWCERFRCPAGCSVATGNSAGDIHVIIEGCIKLFTTLPDGRQQIIAFETAGDFLGLGASLGAGNLGTGSLGADRVVQKGADSGLTSPSGSSSPLPSPSSLSSSVPCRGFRSGIDETAIAETLVVTTLCRFPVEVVENLARDFPELSLRLRQACMLDVRRLQGQLLLLGRKTARERLASFLLEASGRLQPLSPSARLPWFRLPMSRSDIADYLGLTLETVSRQFGQFRRENFIRLEGIHRFCLLEPEKLRALAGGHLPSGNAQPHKGKAKATLRLSGGQVPK